MLNPFERKMFVEMLEKLNTVTAACRDSMHEPDGQGISAVVLGDHLDNAGCRDEYRVGLYSEDEATVEWFNRASLTAGPLPSPGGDRDQNTHAGRCREGANG